MEMLPASIPNTRREKLKLEELPTGQQCGLAASSEVIVLVLMQ